MREDIGEIIKFIYDLGLEKWIVTNGTYIDDDMISIFKNFKVNVQVSLDGPDERVNDYIRGEGSFRRAIKAIKMLVGNGVRTKIGVTLTKYNYNLVKKFVSLAENLGVDEVQFSSVVMAGRANKYNMSVSVTQLREFSMQVLDSASRYSVSISHERIFYQNLLSQSKRYACGGCGRDRISINSIGDVYPCQTMHHPEFFVGNIRKDRLIYLWINSEKLNELRHHNVDNIEKCSACSWKYVCMEGCISETFYLTGDYRKTSSPVCEWYKEIFPLMLKYIGREHKYLKNKYRNISGAGIKLE